MKWVTDLYGQWHEHRLEAYDCPSHIVRSDLSNIPKLQKTDLAYSLQLFITEIKKLNGENYPPITLYQMIICLQMSLEYQKVYWRLLTKEDPDFVDLFYTVDNIMKQKPVKGLVMFSVQMLLC